MMTQEQRHRHWYGIFIVNFEHIKICSKHIIMYITYYILRLLLIKFSR